MKLKDQVAIIIGRSPGHRPHHWKLVRLRGAHIAICDVIEDMAKKTAQEFERPTRSNIGDENGRDQNRGMWKTSLAKSGKIRPLGPSSSTTPASPKTPRHADDRSGVGFGPGVNLKARSTAPKRPAAHDEARSGRS